MSNVRLLPFPEEHLHTFDFVFRDDVFCYVELVPTKPGTRTVPSTFSVKVFITYDVRFQHRGACIELPELPSEVLPQKFISDAEAFFASGLMEEEAIWSDFSNSVAKISKLEFSPPNGGRMYLNLTIGGTSLSGGFDADALRRFFGRRIARRGAA